MIGRRSLFALVPVLASAALAGPSRGADFPRLWGPEGDGRAAEDLAIPASGSPSTRQVWRRAIGSGYSGIAVVGARAYTGMAHQGTDHVVAFDVATGREAWRATIGPTYKGHSGSHDGPIATPTVADGRVFLVGPHGVLVGLDAATGKELWRHDLTREYSAAPPVYGFGTSPLVAGNLVVVHAGGAIAQHVAAFDAKTGALVWSARPAEQRVYSSPILATVGGRPQVVGVAGDKVFGLDPKTGAVVFSHALNWNEEISRSPLVLPDGSVLVSSWGEAALVKVTPNGQGFTTAEAWRTPRLKNSYSAVVHRDGMLYGFSGGFLTCVDAATGEPRWRQRTYTGSLLLAGRHLLVLGDKSGELIVVEATPEAYRERARTPVFAAGATSITAPALAGGRVYVRNLEEIVALEIGG
ncbi:MAG TPA: PQQ-binding-like beta-propeller repeat protein [Vicinamibacteria bacterium]|jgi:outer membrane protein assembly factor BamB